MSKKQKIRKEDKSPQVAQRNKVDFDFKIKEMPWTEKQKKFIELAMDKNTKIVFLKGSAGTSKTMITMYVALQLLKSKKISDIILVRSAVESADSKLGFLPGDLMEKFGVYVTPFRDKMDELLEENTIKRLEKDSRVQMVPINFARGLHWAAKCILADEAQNFTIGELKTLLTRTGQFSKVFICGDPSQSDLMNGKSGGFIKVYDLFDNDDSKSKGVFTFEFNDDDDVIRSEIVKYIIKQFNTLNPTVPAPTTNKKK